MGVTRAVIFVADPDDLPFWKQAFDQRGSDLQVVPLLRYTEATLQSWTLWNECFTARSEQLLQATSGWPCLVERALRLSGRHGSEEKALDLLNSGLETVKGADAFLRGTGVLTDPQLTSVLKAIVDYEDDFAYDELLYIAGDEQAAHPAPETAIACLNAMQVFDRQIDGAYRVDPLLAELCRRLGWPVLPG